MMIYKISNWYKVSGDFVPIEVKMTTNGGNVREQESNYSQNASFTNSSVDKSECRPGLPRRARPLPKNACGLQPFRPCPEA